MILSNELLKKLSDMGYMHITYIDGVGLCALFRYMFTIGLVYNIDETGHSGRYCYPHENGADALIALKVWNGEEDPQGRWVKHKGVKGEYSNPKLKSKDA